ncbi:hypothetical protein LXL04_004773 [Taraxacum kok-saghyz]
MLIIGLAFAVVFFGLMRQANAWELDLPIPSLLSTLESNLKMPIPFLLLSIPLILIALFYSCLSTSPIPAFTTFFFCLNHEKMVILNVFSCYLIANGIIIILILTTHILSHMVARVHVFFKTRWRWWIRDNSTNIFSFKVTRVINVNSSLATSIVAISLVCFVHPALGLLILIFSHATCCHHALCSYFTASSKARSEDLFGFKNKESESGLGLGVDENSSGTPDSTRSYGETQLEIYHHRHGLLILHLLSLLMFLPSLVAGLSMK